MRSGILLGLLSGSEVDAVRDSDMQLEASDSAFHRRPVRKIALSFSLLEQLHQSLNESCSLHSCTALNGWVHSRLSRAAGVT